MAKKKATKRGKTSARGRRTASRRSAKRSKSGSRKAARKTARRSTRKPAAKKTTARKTSARKAPKRSSAPKRPAPKKAAAASTPSGEMYGEGNWRADEEYRQGIKEFSRTHDSEGLAREAAKDIEGEGARKPGKPQAAGKPPAEEEDDAEW